MSHFCLVLAKMTIFLLLKKGPKTPYSAHFGAQNESKNELFKKFSLEASFCPFGQKGPKEGEGLMYP